MDSFYLFIGERFILATDQSFALSFILLHYVTLLLRFYTKRHCLDDAVVRPQIFLSASCHVSINLHPLDF